MGMTQDGTALGDLMGLNKGRAGLGASNTGPTVRR